MTTDETRARENETIYHAQRILAGRLREPGATMTAPQAVRDFLHLHLADREQESFMCVWVDAQNRMIESVEMFRGTLTQTAVYPREVVKAALRANAAGVIFAHNHPSGVPAPSRADELITQQLKQALALVEVKVLDHFIVAGARDCSFAELGLL